MLLDLKIIVEKNLYTLVVDCCIGILVYRRDILDASPLFDVWDHNYNFGLWYLQDGFVWE
jgi:hypothetical protein